MVPAGDKRCRQNWIDAIAGVQPPLLALLEVVEPVAEPIEVQATEPIESKFGRSVYPKPATKPIAQAAENSPGVTFDPAEFRETHASEIEDYLASFTEADRPPNRGDNGRDRLESEQEMSKIAIASTAAHQLLERLKSSVHAEDFPTLSDSFLARYPPPRSENIHYQADADGQLNLLDFELESVSEPPDPDDFDSLDAFHEALARWDAENPEPLAVSMDSMTEWAPCPDDWYEPEAENLASKDASRNESCKCWNFSIPTFDAWCDRTNDTDEPPDTGIFARLPKPKPPSFPPMRVVAGDRTNRIKKFARSAILLSGRAPPGGDASF